MPPKPKPSRRTVRPARKADKNDANSNGAAGSRVIREMPRRAAAPAMPKAGAKPVESRGKYVYCVIRSEDQLRFGAIGLGAVPSEVSTVHYKDIAAVVS